MILYDMQHDTSIVTRLEKCESNLKRYIKDIYWKRNSQKNIESD